MKPLFDATTAQCSQLVTKAYSTSFSWAVRLLGPSIRPHIYNIYAFVRFADEIVDTFHGYEKEQLLNDFEADYYKALEAGISLNPILNSFVLTVKKYNIRDEFVQAFLRSMRMDLHKKEYRSFEEYREYIYGSADVVGLMCLQVFVKGDDKQFEQLREGAMRLGSAFQKVNFLRDIKADTETLDRQYFPHVDLMALDKASKQLIVKEIEADFDAAYKAILALPVEAKLGVYTAYVYYKRLLKKLKMTPHHQILNTRIRVSNPRKVSLLMKSYVQFKLNLL